MHSTPDEEGEDGNDENEAFNSDTGEPIDSSDNNGDDKGNDNASNDPDEGKSDDEIRDELTGQLRLF